jgi:hypothetical protein
MTTPAQEHNLTLLFVTQIMMSFWFAFYQAQRAKYRPNHLPNSDSRLNRFSCSGFLPVVLIILRVTLLSGLNKLVSMEFVVLQNIFDGIRSAALSASRSQQVWSIRTSLKEFSFFRHFTFGANFVRGCFRHGDSPVRFAVLEPQSA